jgi:hypothetical protein
VSEHFCTCGIDHMTERDDLQAKWQLALEETKEQARREREFRMRDVKEVTAERDAARKALALEKADNEGYKLCVLTAEGERDDLRDKLHDVTQTLDNLQGKGWTDKEKEDLRAKVEELRRLSAATAEISRRHCAERDAALARVRELETDWGPLIQHEAKLREDCITKLRTVLSEYMEEFPPHPAEDCTTCRDAIAVLEETKP